MSHRGLATEITSRKRAEEQARALSRMYAALSGINEAILRAGSADELMRRTCQIAVKSGSFVRALIRLVDRASGLATLVALAGDEGPRRSETLSVNDDAEEAGSLVRVAYREGRPVVLRDVRTDPRVREWKLPVASHPGVVSAAGFPLRRAGQCVGVLVLHGAAKESFDGEMTPLVERMAENVSFGLENLAAAEDLRRFRLAMDNSADMILLIDRATMRFADVNRTVCTLLGYTREEMLAMGPQDVLSVSRAELELAYDRLIADPSAPSGMKGHYRCKDGSLLPFEVTRKVLRSGDGWLVAAISRDIRERLAAEARFRGLTGLSSDMYWAQDKDYRFTELSGTGPLGAGRERILGRRRWEQDYFNMSAADWAAHKATLDARRPFHDLELGRINEAGDKVWVSVSGEPVFDQAGAFAGYRGVGKDITQRKREEALRELEHGVSRCLAEADSACSGLEAVIRLICESQSWQGGRYVAADEATGPLRGESFVFPVRAQGKTVGVLSFSAGEARPPDGRLQEAVQVIASQVGQFLMRKLAEERRAAHLHYQEKLSRFGQSALAKREAAELVGEAVQTVLETLAAEAVAYLEPGPGEREVVQRALVGAAAAGPDAATTRLRDDNPILRALDSGARRKAPGARLQFPWAHGLQAMLNPVRGESGTRGVLCVCAGPADAFSAEALNFIEAMASVLSTGLQRIDSERRLAYLAQFDPLTGLPNRALLADRFSQMIAHARRRQRPLVVLFIDLDEFKLVNDTLGHTGGDELLKEVAARLQSAVRPDDTVARISGDEFAVVLADLARTEDAALVAQKIIERLAAPVDVLGQEVFVTASVGIAGFPGDGADAEALIGAADAAMYRAKQSGRNAFQFFTADINQRSRARAQLGAELRRALEREEFALVYQPKFRLADRGVSGAEALLRWRHPERGMVPPAEFIPVLEETGLIVPVGEWVLRRACEDLKAWRAAGLDAGPVAVNLSARQFRLPSLDARLKALVAGTGVEPSLIELEITESQLMQDPDHAIRVMRSLREAGMRIAIDDFGTGYSSLSYLTRFPVGSLKIDRSFVARVNEDASAGAIVRTIIEMAHTLGFTVVAEGIETEAQAHYLQRHRCEQGQGYLFARPMAAGKLAGLLQGIVPERQPLSGAG
ncbi:MAG TPA: EAL domain-containing protein [Burkholderiales bacterium]